MKSWLLLLAFAGSVAAAALQPQHLRCEYRVDPQGIDVTQPRLSWVLAGPDAQARGLRQTAYRLMVGSNPRVLAANTPDLWDSAKVESGQSIQVVYRGKPLTSGAAAYWKVQVWDQDGKASEWSTPASWTMGLLSPTDWHAKWIGGEETPEAGGDPAGHHLAARLLRKEFAVSKRVRRASVYYSGLGLSELNLNGAKVGTHVLSPGLTDYDKHVLYVTFDVTAQLVSGPNAIGLMLGNGRYYAPRANRQTRDFGFPKAILQLDIEYDDGTRAQVVSDESWKLSTAGPVRANNEYDGEEYDARMEMAGWSRAGFNDSTWKAAGGVTRPTGVLTAQMAEPLRVTETLKPVSVHALKPGVWIFDMGQNMVGWCQLAVSGPAGTHVTLRHAETLNPDGSLYTANLRTARATDVYTLKGGGPEIWEPRFTYHGFRYVEMTGFPGTPAVNTLAGRVVHDDMEKTADFTTSDALLNQIHHNMFWGIRGNYRSIPTDCPQRDERQGWLGDRSQVSRSETYMFDVAAFYSKWETDIADSEKPDGSVPTVSPNYWPNYHDDLTWPSTFLFVPGMLYDQYADRRVLEREYPAMKRWIEHERGFLKDGLMPKDMYGDWCVPPEDPKLIHSKDPARITDKTLLGTAYYYDLLRLMARYARMLDQPTDAAQFESEAAAANAAFQKRFFVPASRAYDNGTQTSSILPLYFDMVPADERAGVLANLVRNIEEKSDYHVGTGLVGAQWLMRTLSDNGQADLAYRIATQKTYPGWGYMVEQGATTIWELWNGNTADPAMNSGNHVMQIGDLAVWMYEYLAGIRSDPAKPGFQHAIIKPYPVTGLTFVKASHKSMYGTIASSWNHEAGQFTLDLTVPPNTSATVMLPAKNGAPVTESGHPVAQAKGVKFVRNEGDRAVYEVESGVYRFRASF
jgi:alpha-L-rhamnosidase